jgi:hypothetical protein
MKTFKEFLQEQPSFQEYDSNDETDAKHTMFYIDEIMVAAQKWLIQSRVEAEDREAKYDAYIIQDLIDRLEIPRKEEAKTP